MRAAAFAFTLAFATGASAVPVRLLHTGFLLNASDEPVTETDLALTLSIWDDASATGIEHQVWKGKDCTISPLRGHYAVELGGDCTGPLDSAKLPPDGRRWLEVAVQTTTLTPRLGIVPVPNAT